MFSVEMLSWTCDVWLPVRHRFSSGVENTKQPPRLGPVVSLLIEAPAVYGKQAQSCQAVCLLKAPEHDLIREKPKHCDQQRKAWQTSAEQ